MHIRLLLLASLTCAVCGTGVMRAQTPADPGFTLSNIGPNVWAAIDNPKAQQRTFVNAGPHPIRRMLQGAVVDPFGHMWLIGKILEQP